MNKKVLSGIVLLLVVAVATGGYVVFKRGRSEQQLLQYVPSDTILFAGSVKPVDVKKYLELSRSMAGFAELPREQLEKIEEAGKGKSPAAHFLVRLYLDYLDQFRKGPEAVLAYYGFADKAESAVYMVGAVPVARFSLRDPSAFTKAIGNAEQTAGFTPKIEKIGDLQVRRYSVKAEEEGKPGLDILVATGANVGVITVDSTKLDGKTRALALGQEKPSASLASGKLAKLASAHELDNDNVFYVDFVEIGKSLVDPKNTLFGQHLQMIFGDMPNLASVQTPACQKEIPAFLSNVPRLVGGLKGYKATETGLEMTVVYDLEITNADVLKSLNQLRGVLPKYLLAKENLPTVWFGLGVDLDKVAPTVTRMVQDFGAQTYECEPLLKAQNSMKNANMAGLMALGLVRGVKGVSAAAYKLDFTAQKSGSSQGLDAIITLSATDPMVLWQMAAKWLPNVTLPKNGDPVDVPLPNGTSVKVALNGNHIVAFLGEKSTQAAQQFKGQDLTPNGMFTYGYDYGLFGQFASLAKKSADPAVDAEAMFKNLAGVKISAVSDFRSMGWRNEIVLQVPKPKGKPST